MGSKPNPRMVEAVAWMRETGGKARAAAEKFELPLKSVQAADMRWRSEEDKKKRAEKAKKGKAPETVAAPPPPRPPPARAKVELDDEVREGLQRGARQAVAAIADDLFMRTDPQGWANICRGLDAVIRFAPDAVALRKKLAPDSAGGDGAVDDLAAAMGVDPKAPASVTVLAGGKRATS